MNARTFHLPATDAFAGVQLRKLTLSPISGLLYIFLLLPFVEVLLVHEWETPILVGGSLLLFTLLVIHLFSKEKLLVNQDHPLLETQNIAELLSWNMVRHLSAYRSIDALALLKASTASSRSLFILGQIGIDRDMVLKHYLAGGETHDFQECLQWGLDACKELKTTVLDSTAVLYAFFEHSTALHTLLDKADLSFQDLGKIMQCEVFHWYSRRYENPIGPDALVRILGSFGRSWVMGYTNELDRLTIDIGESILSKRRDAVIHHDKLDEMLRLLAGAGHRNVLIIGKNGVGKRTMIENFTRALRMYEIDHGLPYTRVLKLRSAELLSGSDRSDTLLLHALSKAENSGKFILVAEDIAMLMKAADARLKQVLLKFLQHPRINLIGIADVEDYHSTLKREGMIDALLEKVYLDDASEPEVMDVLMSHYFSLEHRKKVRMTYKALQSIPVLSRRYIGRGGFPGKAVEVMDEAILVASQEKASYVSEKHIRSGVSLKAHIDVTEMSDGERNKLLTLAATLIRNVVGQDEAIRSLVNALKRARLDIATGNRPLGTFLFLGSTGVGKTETAKTLAEHYFGSHDSFTRIDLNEYSTEQSVNGIIGTTDTNGVFHESFLVQRIQDRPFSLILLDEIEKAHPHVLNLFLQILDEGYLIDARGLKTDFRNAIIIATSNAGGLYIRDALKANPNVDHAAFKQLLIDNVLKDKLFSPEFLNRFDDVLVYFPLSEQHVARLTILMLDHIVREMDQKRGIRIIVEHDVVDVLAKRGYSVEFGARQLRRTITDVIENYIADYMLKHVVKRGDEIMITAADLLEREKKK